MDGGVSFRELGMDLVYAISGMFAMQKISVFSDSAGFKAWQLPMNSNRFVKHPWGT